MFLHERITLKHLVKFSDSTFLQVAQSSLRDLLLQCCMDDDAPDVRQSAFALLGDLARVSLKYINWLILHGQTCMSSLG